MKYYDAEEFRGKLLSQVSANDIKEVKDVFSNRKSGQTTEIDKIIIEFMEMMIREKEKIVRWYSTGIFTNENLLNIATKDTCPLIINEFITSIFAGGLEIDDFSEIRKGKYGYTFKTYNENGSEVISPEYTKEMLLDALRGKIIKFSVEVAKKKTENKEEKTMKMKVKEERMISSSITLNKGEIIELIPMKSINGVTVGYEFLHKGGDFVIVPEELYDIFEDLESE